MLDIHPPEHTPHTWRDFLIHIATIVVGLLIAIGLEQTVEYFQHRHEVAETRAALAQEQRANVAIFHRDVAGHVEDMGYLHNDLRIFEYLKAHPGTPDDKLPGVLFWSIFTSPPVESAWLTAQHTDVLPLMPRDEVTRITATYAALDYASQFYQSELPRIERCTSFYTQTADPATLSPAEVDAEIAAIKDAMEGETMYGAALSEVGAIPAFGPIPTWFQMMPYFKMQDYVEWIARHPDVEARSNADLEGALAQAGLPANTPDQRSFMTPQELPKWTGRQVPPNPTLKDKP